MWTWFRSLADAFLGKVPGKSDRLDTATRMAMDADFRSLSESREEREEARKVDQIDELVRILGDQGIEGSRHARMLRLPNRRRPKAGR
jgi:hypothetical protein